MTKNRAYEIAEERINDALDKRSISVDLSGGAKDFEKLTEIPNSLFKLTQIRSLNLANNRLASLPDWLTRCNKLEVINLSSNNLTYAPDTLFELTKIRVLDLSENRIETIPESLGRLAHLQTLGLYRNHLRSLPKTVGRLTQLRSLRVGSNGLIHLPESLGDLKQLDTLSLFFNGLTTLPETVSELDQLKTLDLYGNKLSMVPNCLRGLTNLQDLDLGGNHLAVLPEWLGELICLETLNLAKNQLTRLPESLTKLSALTKLFLHENPKLGLPDEILGAKWTEDISDVAKAGIPRAILAFYLTQRTQRAKRLNEVKLLLVGHGRVGKTSLSKALRGVNHDEREPETPGIERNPLSLTAHKSIITAHIWDFGGQEFLHQTHQFFFSERSIYVVVLTGRQGRPMQEAEYWLRLIRTYGTDSPVVIVLNQIKAHPFSVDELFLQENYPEVKAIVKTDCDPRFGIEPLRKLLGRLAAGMPSVREKIDPAWARVRGRLEDMKASFITFDAYRQMCSAEGVKTTEDQETLATILDCLGIALNYREDPRLRDTSVLKPRWLVDGIYMILRWLHRHETNGEMQLADFAKALRSKRSYPPEMHRFLLTLMEKFELCFPLDAREDVYLVPGLLDANQPHELRKFKSGKAQRIQFRYDDVRPPGLLPRFIVRSHTLSEKQPRWLRGVVLARGAARALVRGDHEGRLTDVFALGENSEERVWLTEFILSEMRVLNEKLPVRTFVEDQPGVWTELEILRDAVRRDEVTRVERATSGSTVTVDVLRRLREVESPEASTRKDKPISLFICYAHANEQTVKRMIPSLKVLARRGYIAPWRDTDLVPGEDWDDTIKQRLLKSQIILFMVSTDFLASRYITEQERPLAMSLMKEKKAIVVPVLLSSCSWRDEDFASLEKLPRKDDPVSSFNPRDKAWFLVEEGIKQTVKSARTSLNLAMSDFSTKTSFGDR